LTLTGVPENQNTGALDYPGTNTPAATMVYVNGSASITGPSSGAAVQNNTMLSVTANGNIQQTGNLTYATEPVTTSQNQSVSYATTSCCNGQAADSLIPLPSTASNQVLGLFTSNGQFQLNPSAGNNANIETDASIAMISQTQRSCGTNCMTGEFATPGNSVGTWTNIGGRVENSINGVEINTGNVYFDRRFTARTNFAPPWFPATTIAAGDISSSNHATITPTTQRIQWVSTTGGQ
jgi:hypothetical protein